MDFSKTDADRLPQYRLFYQWKVDTLLVGADNPASKNLGKVSRSNTLANSPQARKRARQNDKRRAQNSALRSKMRTYVKSVRNAIAAGEKEKAEEAYKAAVPVLDSMCGKGIVQKNTAARYKSRMNAAIKSM